jgi:phosphonopyruvate decarboxylase
MIQSAEFLAELKSHGVRAFYGVPDSLLKGFCAAVSADEEIEQLIAANEGGAVALAAGYHLATGETALVYLQNSGLGNTVNPLTSLTDPEVYSIPLILVIGWRAEPGVPDEPQHKKQGAITLSLLETLGIPSRVLSAEDTDWRTAVEWATSTSRTSSAPVALVIRKGTFTVEEPARSEGQLPLTREQAIQLILEKLPTDTIYVGSTGEISRELYEHRVRRNEPAGRDFLTVGSMGHSSQIALGIARQINNKIICVLDGDGGALMHLGSLAINGSHGPGNFLHIVLNNGAHGSVGGQPTVGFQIDLPQIAEGCGYKTTAVAKSAEDLTQYLTAVSHTGGPALIEVQVRLAARKDLGRPKGSARANKESFMESIR